MNRPNLSRLLLDLLHQPLNIKRISFLATLLDSLHGEGRENSEHCVVQLGIMQPR